MRNGLRKWNKETDAFNREETADGDPTVGVTDAPVEGIKSEPSAVVSNPASDLKELLLEDAEVPWYKVGLIAVVFVSVMLFNVLRGSSDGSIDLLGITCGDRVYWWLTFIVIPICFIFWGIIRWMTVLQFHRREAANWVYVDGDVVWSENNTLTYPCVAILAGLIAGMFGIGGGIINGPLMVELGYEPSVAAATGATMLLLTSFTSTMMYILFDLLNPQYAIILLCVGFSATTFGQSAFNCAMGKFVRKRDSLIIFVIAFIVCASAIMMGAVGIITGINYFDGSGHVDTGICQDSDKIIFPPILGAMFLIFVIAAVVYIIMVHYKHKQDDGSAAVVMVAAADIELKQPEEDETAIMTAV